MKKSLHFESFLAKNRAVELSPATLGFWKKVVEQSSFSPVWICSTEIAYQERYFGDNFPVENWSLIFQQNGYPIGIAPLLLHRAPEGASLKTLFLPIMMPIWCKEISLKSQKSLNKVFIQSLITAARTSGMTQLQFRFQPNDQGQMEGYRFCLETGGTVQITHEMSVDLSLPLEVIRGRMRDSYRALINKGQRTWATEIIESENDLVISEFMEFHLKISGRKTRSEETWKLRAMALKNREALIVTLRGQDKQLVGAAFFPYSHDESVYGIGVYERELFDHPLGHLVQWAAIEKFKSIGLRRHILGARVYPSDMPTPSEKDLSICKFKEGFMTELSLWPVVSLKVGPG